MTKGQTITGTRHHDGCLCGCERVAGREGIVIEAQAGWVVARFRLTCCGREKLTAYESCDGTP